MQKNTVHEGNKKWRFEIKNEKQMRKVWWILKILNFKFI